MSSPRTAPSGPPPPERSLGGRLRHARRRGFVGRERELAAFGQALAGESTARVLLLHGAGGIGKTTLLDRMAHEAAEAGRAVVRVDAGTASQLSGPGGEHGSATWESVSEAVVLASGQSAPVLLVDSIDRCADLESPLRHELLPALPEDAVVLVAGRQPPEAEWTTDPGWRELVRVLGLEHLSEYEAGELLGDKVPAALRAQVLDFALGHPLALSLAADDVARSTELEQGWSPSLDLLQVLLNRLLDPVWQRDHGVALAVCGHARGTTVELLRAVLDDAGPTTAAAEFSWLGTLACVGAERSGLRFDPLTERLVDAVNQWRDPAGHEELRRRVWRHQADRVLTGGPEALDAVDTLLRLSERRSVRGGAGATPTLHELSLGTGLVDAVTALAESSLGAECLPPLHHWLERQPEAFTVYGTEAGPVSFMACLRLAELTEADQQADPVLAGVAKRLHHAGPLLPGEEVSLLRFLVSDHPGAGLSPGDPRLRHWCHELVAAAGRMALSYVSVTEPAGWASCLGGLDHHLVADSGPLPPAGLDRGLAEPAGPAEPDEAGAAVPERREEAWGLFEHDWRQVPLGTFLERVFPADHERDHDHAELADGPRLPGRDDFDDALRELLRQWRDDGAVAVNLLTRCGVGSDLAVAGDPVSGIRRAVEEAVTELAEDPRRIKHGRALASTYLRASLTQEAAAARLGVPFGTFRRHLSRGTALLADLLWARLQRQGVPGPSTPTSPISPAVAVLAPPTGVPSAPEPSPGVAAPAGAEPRPVPAG